MKGYVIVAVVVMLCAVSHGSITQDMYDQCYAHGIEQISQGNLEAARRSFEQALGFKPGDPNAVKAIRLIDERTQKQNANSVLPNDDEDQKEIPLAEEKAARVAPESEFKEPSNAVKNESQKDFSIRVSLGSAPGIDEEESDFWIELPISEEGGGQLEILAVQRFWSKNNPNLGGVLGGGVFFSGNSGKYLGGGPDIELAAFGVMGEGGIVAKLGERVVVEAMPYLGIGGASVEITGFTDGSAPYLMYGVKGGVFILLSDNVELGLELGYGGFSSEVELQQGLLVGDNTFKGSGGRASMVLALKF